MSAPFSAGVVFTPEVGLTFYSWINQAYRHCTILKVTPGRVRIAYDTNENTFQAWRYRFADGQYCGMVRYD